MKGKIDKNGYLWKDAPVAGWVKCTCVNSACLQTGDFYCYHGCVAFEGPIPEKRCMKTANSKLKCIENCDICPMHLPTGRTEIHYCQGILRFDQFEDERVPK